jgi:hypothetical protein
MGKIPSQDRIWSFKPALPPVHRRGSEDQHCQHKPLQPGIAKNGGGQNARATGGPGILPET